MVDRARLRYKQVFPSIFVRSILISLSMVEIRLPKIKYPKIIQAEKNIEF